MWNNTKRFHIRGIAMQLVEIKVAFHGSIQEMLGSRTFGSNDQYTRNIAKIRFRSTARSKVGPYQWLNATKIIPN